jgi:tripartite-type tricarboxylate transporter receptor subunit TctC
LPQVPTMAEAGLPGFEMSGWTGMFVPAGTPKSIIDKISGEMAGILALPEIVEKLGNEGLEPFISNPEQFAALLRSDMARFAKLIKDANIKVEQ